MTEDEGTYGVPAVLSFFMPGVGQIIKGQAVKGIAIIIAMIMSLMLTIFGIGFATTPLLWLWNVYDAYTAHEDQHGLFLKGIFKH